MLCGALRTWTPEIQVLRTVRLLTRDIVLCVLGAWARMANFVPSEWTNEWKASLWLQKLHGVLPGHLNLLNLNPSPSLAGHFLNASWFSSSVFCLYHTALVQQWALLLCTPAMDCPLMWSLQPLHSHCAASEVIGGCLFDYVSLLPKTFQMVSHFNQDQA